MKSIFRHITSKWLIAGASTLLFAVAASAAENSEALREPVKTVLAEYGKISDALAKDSVQGIGEHARAIAKAIRDDKGRTLSLSAADRAEKLANAKNLKATREAFRSLSDSLIVYLSENKVSSTGLKEAFCPMVQASWLQKGEKLQNPYMGQSMPRCGEVKRTF